MAHNDFKYLRDFPVDEWFEAADGCDYCGVRYRVMINMLEEGGIYGEVLIRDGHMPECLGPDDVDRLELAGWEYGSKRVTINGVAYRSIWHRCDVTICLSCGRLIVDGPFVVLLDGGKHGELDFCHSCVEDLGIPAEKGLRRF
jgi:hypothetical protein